jgi:luciferase family oxidoreductase group 1
MPLPLSLLDLAFVAPGDSPREALAGCVAFARRAEALGYRRVWYAEHHNMPLIASSATSVLIAHVAAQTRSIRLGSGGIMLPNHSPLSIAEQFGTLASLHPDRIDLGLGRAPGTDPATSRALRVPPHAADGFPSDILELQGYLGEESVVHGVEATPGKGTHVPLYLLGSSLFGAKLAARLGLPYAFASHFAPALLEQAVAAYRREFRPSKQTREPYVIAGLNVIASDTKSEAQAQFAAVQRAYVKSLFGRGMNWSEEQAQAVLESPHGEAVKSMTTYAAVGTPSEVHAYIDKFAIIANADELMTVHPARSLAARLRSIELLAEAPRVRETRVETQPAV